MKIDWKHVDIKDLAAIVVETFRKKNIDVLLVGGACISMYTHNKYISGALDFISHAALKEISEALQEIGFQRESSRHFMRDDCPFFIEFVSPPAAVGSEPIHSKNEINTKYGRIVLLTPTDTVKDRLAAYYHWNDPQALEQATMVAEAQKVDLKEVRRWSLREGFKEKYDSFIVKLRR
ncbi:MAG TPA: hypothetical protein DCP92_20860 [Nitrospiraceae bacterium]|jgi:hypothetical protein|nr:hypothetical protein [Nitrospiraceae bacterium]